MALSEDEELELLQLEKEKAMAETAPADAGVDEEPLNMDMAVKAGSDLAEGSLEGTGKVLEAPLPGVGKAALAARGGLEKAAGEAERFYAERGMDSLATVAGTGGRFLSGAIPARTKDALFMLAAGPALKLAGKGLAPIARAGGNFLADVAGTVAGKSPEAVKAIFKKPGALWKTATEVFGLKHQEALVQHIDEGLKARGAQFRQIEDSLSHFTQTTGGKPVTVQVRPVFDDVTKEMLYNGHHLPKKLVGRSPAKVGRIAENKAEYKEIVKNLEIMKKTPKMNFQDALNLRRRLDDAINYGVEGSNGLQPLSSEGTRVLRSMRGKINKSLRDSVPRDIRPMWDKANATFKEAADAYGELRKQVVGTTPRMTERKLMQMIQEGRYDDEVLSRATKLGESAARNLESIKDHLASNEFKRWLKGGFGNGMPLGLPTSPRLVGMGVSGAGGMSKLAEIIAGIATKRPALIGPAMGGAQNVLEGPR